MITWSMMVIRRCQGLFQMSAEDVIAEMKAQQAAGRGGAAIQPIQMGDRYNMSATRNM